LKASQAAVRNGDVRIFSRSQPRSHGHKATPSTSWLRPKDLTWADVSRRCRRVRKSPVIEGPNERGKGVYGRLKLPANYKIPAHSHPAIEHVTVISGTFNMGTGDKLDPKQTKALSVGSVAIVQPRPTTSADESGNDRAASWRGAVGSHLCETLRTTQERNSVRLRGSQRAQCARRGAPPLVSFVR